MNPPAGSRAPSPLRRGPRPAAARAHPQSGDRLLRTLVSLADDLTVERDEAGLVQSMLEHLVESLALGGGIVFAPEDDADLGELAEHHLAADRTACRDLAKAVLAQNVALVQELAGAGWLAATPLRARRKSLGVLVLHETGATEPSLDRALLEVLGKQVGTGIENVRLYAELRTSSARAEVLRRITAAATSGSDLAAIVPAFAAEVHALQAFDRLACGFVNDTGDYIEMVSHPEGTSWGLGGVLPVVGSGPGFVALNNRPVLQRDLVHEHRYLEDMRLLEEGLRSYAIFPLTSRERAVGVLALGSREGGAFDEGTLARLQPLADAVALAFENVRLFQRTRELSITDEVTPLHNFRYFHQALERELKLVNRYGSTLSLLFVDLDRFKPINDQYGHLRGSRTLREVGFLIRAAVRETDIPARYGGDEFVVILPQTDAPSARVLAEKLRRLVEGHTFLQEEGINARLGVSLGIANYPEEATTKEALIRLADRRMYEDKDTRRTGR
ncbi:MAG TPA: diguanylate cyclase [Vicinamibacteria bacterium]|nr:diguanylate cyclase [Vicinamibacteria bacterium]